MYKESEREEALRYENGQLRQRVEELSRHNASLLNNREMDRQEIKDLKEAITVLQDRISDKTLIVKLLQKGC
jgi:hypothetical protein